ncbi:MAG: LysE family translocator [Acidiferrobacter sp.]
MTSLLLGILVGICISAPIGPVGLLTIQRTLAQGRLAGFVSGAGAATADTFYGGLAALGLSEVSGFLVHDQMWIYLGASILCFWIGLRAIFFHPMKKVPFPHHSSQGLFWNYISSIALALANPLTIVFCIVAFAILNIDHTGTEEFLLTVMGIFTGCLFAWASLAIITTHFHAALNNRMIVRINRISASIILVIGLIATVSAVHMFIARTS